MTVEKKPSPEVFCVNEKELTRPVIVQLLDEVSQGNLVIIADREHAPMAALVPLEMIGIKASGSYSWISLKNRKNN